MPGTLLTDTEIIACLSSGELLIEYEGDRAGSRPFDAERCIQPSSIDLSVGRIYLPPLQPLTDQSAEPNGETGFILPPGHTVLVETEEKLTLSRTISAFGFPPSRLAKNSILMTNPGHVDPGYSGSLKFTLINMGRKEFSIQKSKTIVSLLIFRFDAPVDKGFFDRNPGFDAAGPLTPLLNILSPDFANFTERMRDASEKAVEKRIADLTQVTFDAKQEYDKAAAQADRRRFYIPFFAALAASVLTFTGTYMTKPQSYAVQADVLALKDRLARIEGGQDVDALRMDIERLRNDVEMLRSSIGARP